MQSRKALDNKKVAWAYQKWCEGYTMEEIGDALFVTAKTISRELKGKKKYKPILEYKEEDA